MAKLNLLTLSFHFFFHSESKLHLLPSLSDSLVQWNSCKQVALPTCTMEQRASCPRKEEVGGGDKTANILEGKMQSQIRCT